jgi:hypothetical protein
MEKVCNDVLLQLIDCIESMKNEVKKKMHAVKRALLYQSHSTMQEVKKKIVCLREILPRARPASIRK